MVLVEADRHSCSSDPSLCPSSLIPPLLQVPATYINSMIMYLESKLSIAFRTRLVKYLYEMYMKDDTVRKGGDTAN